MFDEESFFDIGSIIDLENIFDMTENIFDIFFVFNRRPFWHRNYFRYRKHFDMENIFSYKKRIFYCRQFLT